MMKSEQTSGGENMEKFGGTVSLFGACVVGYKDDGTNRDGQATLNARLMSLDCILGSQ